MFSLGCLALTGIVAAGLVSAADNSSIKCNKGLHVFVSRGTGEPMEDSLQQTADLNLTELIGLGTTQGLGMTGAMLKPIFEQIEDSDYTAIKYPATEENPVYFRSAANGTLLVREAMTNYSKACPDSKMAFLGYSQGAQIITNVLCGLPPVWASYADEKINGTSKTEDRPLMQELLKPFDNNVTKNVVAFVLMGDPSATNGTTYQYGTHNNTGNGIFYREDASDCEKYGKRIRSYCDAGDPFCDVGAYFSVGVHTKYVQNHGKEIVEYVVEQFKNGGDGGDMKSSNKEVHENAASGLTLMWALPMGLTILSLVFL